MKKPDIFAPDPRNLGGRNNISTLVHAHKKNLSKSKSTMKHKPPKSLPKKMPKPQYKLKQEFAHVAKTFKSVETAKAIIKVPEAQANEFSKLLTNRYKKEQDYIDREHYNNYRALQMKLEGNRTSVAQRRKNEWDPELYPVYFFRRHHPGDIDRPRTAMNGDKISYEPHKMRMMYKHPPARRYERPTSAMPRYSDDEYENDEVAGHMQYYNSRPEPDDQYAFMNEIPVVEGFSLSDYDDLYKQLKNVVLKYQLFEKADLEAVFGQTLQENAHLERSKVLRIFERIRSDFFP